MFHNFQKHFITLLKKYCSVTPKTFETELQYGKCACILWQTFLKMKTCSKKILNVIFGFSSSIHVETNLNLLAGEFREFRTIKDKYGVDHVVRAQRLLREMTCARMSGISREEMGLKCRVDSFDIFYPYVSWFMDRLREGEVNRRISKKELECILSLNQSSM